VRPRWPDYGDPGLREAAKQDSEEGAHETGAGADESCPEEDSERAVLCLELVDSSWPELQAAKRGRGGAHPTFAPGDPGVVIDPNSCPGPRLATLTRTAARPYHDSSPRKLL